MSASREKKTRQELAGQGLTEKQIKAQQEEQRAKRNRIIYTVVGVVCVVLVAALLIWDSGFFQSRTPALIVGDTTYTVADVEYYYASNYSNARSNAYYMSMYYGYSTGFDYNTSPKEQVYDAEAGTTWHDYFVDSAVNYLTQQTALIKAADAAGYKLSDEGKQTVSDTIREAESSALSAGHSSLNSYLKAMYGQYMTKGKYEEILLRDQRAWEYSQRYVDGLSYTDQDLEAYYTGHTDTMDRVEYNYVSISGIASSTTDEDGNTVQPTEEESAAALEQAKTKADDLKAALERGTSFENATSELETGVYAGQRTYASALSSGSYVYGEWLMDSGRKAGDVTVLTNVSGNGYFVVQFLSRGRNTDYTTADVRHVLVAAEQDEGASAPTQEQYDAAKEKAEQLLANWKANSPTEESFGKMAEENSADTSSAVNGGLMTGVTSSSGYVATFTNWALDGARQPGDTGIVQNTGSSVKGWHIMYFVGSEGEESWKANARSSLINDAYSEWLEGLTSALSVTRESGMDSVG